MYSFGCNNDSRYEISQEKHLLIILQSRMRIKLIISAPENTTGEHESLRQSLEELLKLMLLVWCKENQAIKLVSLENNGKI